MDFIKAHSRYKRRNFDESIQICDSMLHRNSKDQAAWVLKCQCLIKDNYIDQLQIQEDNIAQMMVQQNDKNTIARAGTSFRNSSSNNPIMRPMSNGRISTGFMRAGTSMGSRSNSRANNMKMLRTGRVMTKSGIPTTSNGRILRLSTASLEQHGQNFFQSSKADLKRIAQSRSKSRLIFLYLFYVEHNLRKALQLAIYATQINHFSDNWWKLALGKAYYQLSFYPQAQKQLISAMKSSSSSLSLQCALYLSRIYRKQDNVEKSMKILNQQIDENINPYQPKVYIYLGRLYDQLQQAQKSYQMYQNALSLENCHIEAVANIASYFYYKDQAEISIKLYQRLIEIGYDEPQIWNNIALCAFANNQFSEFYHCFERALRLADDDPELFTDVWYNIGNIYAYMGDTQLALQAYESALGYVPQNVQALNNIAVISYQNGKNDLSINYAQKSFRIAPSFQAAYNLSIWYYYGYQYQRSNYYNKEALKLYPQHAESQELKMKLQKKLELL